MCNPMLSWLVIFGATSWDHECVQKLMPYRCPLGNSHGNSAAQPLAAAATLLLRSETTQVSLGKTCVMKQNHGSLRTGFPMDSDLPHGVASIIHQHPQHPRTSMNYINQKGFRTVLLWLENGLTERIPISEWTLDSCIQMAEHKVIKTYRSPMLIQQSFNMMLIQMIWISAAKKRFVTNKQLLLFAKSNSQKKNRPSCKQT